MKRFIIVDMDRNQYNDQNSTFLLIFELIIEGSDAGLLEVSLPIQWPKGRVPQLRLSVVEGLTLHYRRDEVLLFGLS